MRFLIQRVKYASVKVNNETIGKIENGLMVLVGVGHEDTKEDADYLVKKLVNLRIFLDDNDKTNLSINDVSGELLIISQFTLYADCRKGNRPAFIKAGAPKEAEELYNYIINECKIWGTYGSRITK